MAKILIIYGQYIHLTITIGKIAGCQWPWSFRNHVNGRNLRISMLWSNCFDFDHDHCKNPNFSWSKWST